MSWKKADDSNNKTDSINTENTKQSIKDKNVAAVSSSVSSLGKKDKSMLDEIVQVIKNNKDSFATIASSTRDSNEIINNKIEQKEDKKDKVNIKQNNSNDGGMSR
jgi:hypothetical protein